MTDPQDGCINPRDSFVHDPVRAEGVGGHEFASFTMAIDRGYRATPPVEEVEA